MTKQMKFRSGPEKRTWMRIERELMEPEHMFSRLLMWFPTEQPLTEAQWREIGRGNGVMSR